MFLRIPSVINRACPYLNYMSNHSIYWLLAESVASLNVVGDRDIEVEHDLSLPSLEGYLPEQDTREVDSESNEQRHDDFAASFTQSGTVSDVTLAERRDLHLTVPYIDISRNNPETIDVSSDNINVLDASSDTVGTDISMNGDDRSSRPSRLSLRRHLQHPYRLCSFHGNDARYRKSCPCVTKNRSRE